jgi:hypothetical protein
MHERSDHNITRRSLLIGGVGLAIGAGVLGRGIVETNAAAHAELNTPVDGLPSIPAVGPTVSPPTHAPAHSQAPHRPPVHPQPSNPPHQSTKFHEQPFYIGPDTSSSGQHGYLDYHKLASQGVAFAFARAGYWILDKHQRVQDGLFAGSIARIHDAGLVPGSYYFLRHDRNPKQQAEHYVEILRDTDPIKKNRGSIANIRKGIKAIDLEPSFSDHTQANHADSAAFRARLDELIPGASVLEYSYRNYWKTVLRAADPNSEAWVAIPANGGSNPYAAARHIARPGVAGDPYRLAPWPGYRRWTFRQYTSVANVQNFGNLDFNITFAKFDQLLKLARIERSEVQLPKPLASHP